MASPLGDRREVLIEAKGLGLSLLPAVAVYGANAAGKTTILRALAFMRMVVAVSQARWAPDDPIPVEPFLLDEESRGLASEFEADIWLGSTRFQFGFELNAERVVREWLYAYPAATNRRQTWFERQEDHVSFGKHLAGKNRTIATLLRPNSLFLSAAAQNRHEQLTPIYLWFTRQIAIIQGSRRDLVQQAVEACKDDRIRTQISELLRAADLGIVGLDVRNEDLDEGDNEKSREFAKKLFELLRQHSPEVELPSTVARAVFQHKGSSSAPVAMTIDHESSGTLSWLALLRSGMEALENGGLLVVDELDASLHPLLARRFVELFNSPKTNTNHAQLIFNTHDVSILSGRVLRRDQVWFAEKDQGGATHLYPLSDFKARREENLGRGYLQGRFGAVPYLEADERIAHGE